MTKYFVEINISEFIENDNNDSIFLKKFFEIADDNNLEKTLEKGYKEIKNFIQNILK